MSELKVYVKPIKTNMFGKTIVGQSYYLKSEAAEVQSMHYKEQPTRVMKEQIALLQAKLSQNPENNNG